MLSYNLLMLKRRVEERNTKKKNLHPSEDLLRTIFALSSLYLYCIAEASLKKQIVFFVLVGGPSSAWFSVNSSVLLLCEFVIALYQLSHHV